jgi:hypothetical protein
MGQPTWQHGHVSTAESIGGAKGSRGTETSQYPDEQESNERPLVVASERGSRPNRSRVTCFGVVGPAITDQLYRSEVFERHTAEGASPVGTRTAAGRGS